MASTTVQQLRNDLDDCKKEVGKMEEIVRNINTAISKAESLKIENETMSHLREQKAQLVKDIDNYKHMLQEAEDLKKSWDKNDTAMQTIDHDRQFIDGANRFEIHVSNLENMDKKLISPAKAEQDRIAFRRMESNGVINDLPIVFEFGLLARHQMGGWEVTEDQKKDDYFSFTFRWDEENAKGQEDDLEALRIKATSIVILYDEATNSIVNFDVEPGFEHQWGYGRQRFLQQSVLRKNSQAVFAKAILKDWSEQHEYELGKLTISLLKDSKNQRSDTLELVKLITQMAEKEQIWQEQKIEAEKNVLRLQTEVSQLTMERDTLTLQMSSLETQLIAVRTELQTLQELTDSQSQKTGDGIKGGDTGSTMIQPDLQKKVDKLNDELEALKAAKEVEAKELQDKIDALTQQLTEKDAQLAATSEKIAELENKIETFESQVDSLTAQVNELTKKLADCESQKQKLSDVLDVVEKNVATLTALVEDFKKENESLKAELDAAKKEAEEAAKAAADEKAQLEEKMSVLESELANAKEEINRQNAEISNLEGIAYKYCEDAKASTDQFNDAAKQLADAKSAQDAQKIEIQKALDILQACLAQPEIDVPAAIENNVDCTEYKNTIVPEVQEPEKPVTKPEIEPEPEEKPTVDDPKQEAAVDSSSSSSSSSSSDSSSDSSDNESVADNGYVEPPVVDEVDDDMIIAEKVKETPKPQFFPPKEEPKPVEEETKPEPVQQSVTPEKAAQQKEIPLDLQSMSSVGSKKKEKKLNPVLRALGCFGKNSWGKDETAPVAKDS